MLKILVAGAGAALLAHGLWRRGSAGDVASARARDVLLASLAALSLLAHLNLGRFNNGALLNYADFFHNYVGAKFFPELGYLRLYGCVAVADSEDGQQRRAQRRWTRDLLTNRAAVGHHAIATPTWCTAHFTSDRWLAFRQDVAWFRGRMTPAAWDSMMMSHGYNGTPIGTVPAYRLANSASASDRQIGSLALIDPALLAGMWTVVWWAFGWRTMAVAMIWWGTNQPAAWNWVGGSYLRVLPLVGFVGAICLARRGAVGASGAALAVAAGLRIFPLISAVGLVLSGVTRKSLGPSSSHSAVLKKFSAGGVTAGAVLMVLSFAIPPQPISQAAEPWREFLSDTTRFAQTPLANAIGLGALISFQERTRAVHLQNLWEEYPWDTWRAARSRTFEQRRWAYALIVAGFLVSLALCTRGREPWIALILGAGAVPFLTNLPGYYYSFLLVFAFLWRRFPLVGVLLLTLSALSNLALVLVDARDDLHAIHSLAIVLFVAATMAVVNTPSAQDVGPELGTTGLTLM